MVDEPIATATPAPAVESTAPAVVTETPAVVESAAPFAETAPIAEIPAAEPAKVETSPAEPAKAETPSENPLGDEDGKKPEAKAEPAKTEAPAEPAKVELPVYEDFKLPENFKLEKEPLDAFRKILGEIETGKLDHKGYQETGQKLIDLGTKLVSDSVSRMSDYYVEVHKQNIQKRVDALKADPVLGGENFDKTVTALQASIREYGGTEQQVAEFRKEVTESGLGASPAVCRLIYNMQQKINKYTTEAGGNMVPGQKPAPTKVKPYQAFYQSGGN